MCSGGKMEHVMFIQKVREDKKEEYVKIHKEAWKELLLETKKAGFERQILWLLGNDVLIYSMVENFDEVISKLKKQILLKNGMQRWRHFWRRHRTFLKAGKLSNWKKYMIWKSRSVSIFYENP